MEDLVLVSRIMNQNLIWFYWNEIKNAEHILFASKIIEFSIDEYFFYERRF